MLTQTTKLNLTVRAAGPDDAVDMLRLYFKFCREFKEIPNEPPDVSSSRCFVALDDEKAIGYGTGRPLTVGGRHFTQGEHLFVLQEYRATSAAGMLYRQMVRYGRSRKVPFLVVSAPEQLKFWEKHGYRAWKVVMVKHG